MFPERRLLHEELNALNMIAVQERCVVIDAKVVWISQIMVTHFGGFARVNAHWMGHSAQPCKYILEPSEVTDGCHRRVPEKLVDSRTAQVELDAPGC
jgi:hypothetical protein